MPKTQRLAEFGLLALILLLANVAAQRIFYRCDLTDDKRFTLSEASTHAVENLDDTLTIKAFFSDNIPPSQAALVNSVKDTLAEFKAAGGVKVQVEFVDPYDDPRTEEEMRLLGIPELTMTVFGRDELEQRKVYMGLGIFYADRKEVIQKVDRTNELEYNLTSAILKITREEPGRVAIWLGNPNAGSASRVDDYQRYGPEEELDPLYQALRRQYEVSEVDFAGGRPVPEGTNTLLIIGPKKASERDLYEIDQFIMRGGNVVFLVDVEQHDETMQAMPAPSGLEPLLEFYGVGLGHGMVADRRCERAPFRTRFFQSIMPYPFWPKVTTESISADNPALSGLQAVVIPWTAPLNVVSANLGEKKFDALLSSSEFAKSHDLPAQLFGEQAGLLPATEQSPIILAGLLEGPFKSYFQGKAVPAPAVPPSGPAPTLPPSLTIPEFKDSTDAGRIIVVGSSTFITKQPLMLFDQLRTGAQNLVFLQNLVDWLTLGEGLIGIRSRVAPSYPLEPASEGTKEFLQILNLLAIPVLVVLFGVGRFLLRRRDRLAYEDRYRMAHGIAAKAAREREA